tara:strand:+ start:229 stop:747 length:519 start_codon:yes stop_codon:yes gene_type:complete
MALIYRHFKIKFFNFAPLLLLYFLSVTEIDTEFSNYFEILSFNLQLIVIYYWTLKDSSILGNGHIFFAGIINDIIMGLPMGLSALGYLITALVALYIKNVTVKTTFFTDWFTFVIAIFFSNLVYLILVFNFTDLNLTYTNLFYNSFFTFLFYPIFWLIFDTYRSMTGVVSHD